MITQKEATMIKRHILAAGVAALFLAGSLSVANAGVTTLTVTPGAGATMLEGQQTATGYLFPIIGLSDPNNSTLYASVTAWGTAGTNALSANDNVITWGGGVLGAMANYGTSPGAVLVPGVNAAITNTPTVNLGTLNGTATAANQTTEIGSLATIATNTGASVPAGSATIGGTVPVAGTTGAALSSTWLASAASNNATNVKASAGTLYSVTVTQSTTTAMELKLYNTSTSPTCSSGTSLIDIIPIPSNATSPGYHLTYPVGRAFSTGISYCLVAFGNPAATTDNGNAVVGATLSMTYN